MHICFITHEYPKVGRNQGGVGSVVQTIGRALIAKGITVSVVGIGGVDEMETELDEGVQVYRLPASTWPTVRFISNAYRLVTQLQAIHKQTPIDILEGPELSFAFIPQRFPAKKVIRMHGGHHFFAITLGKKPALWRSFQEKRSFAKADAIAAVSHFVGDTTKKLLNLNKTVTTLYNLVDVQKFYPADATKIIPGKLLFVGTVTEKKGIRQLVQAMPRVIAAFPDVSLDIVGRDWLDPVSGESYTRYLETLIDKGIKKHINLMGSLPHSEIPAKLEEAEICLYPSHMEAMPIAWLEALGMGKAVIASKTGPGSEAIKDKITGLLCDPYSPDDIADKIIYMLTHPEEAQRMGTNARADILQRFDMGKIVQQNIDFYKSVL